VDVGCSTGCPHHGLPLLSGSTEMARCNTAPSVLQSALPACHVCRTAGIQAGRRRKRGPGETSACRPPWHRPCVSHCYFLQIGRRLTSAPQLVRATTRQHALGWRNLNPFVTAVWTLSNACACSRANQSKTSEFARTVMKGLTEGPAKNHLARRVKGFLVWARIALWETFEAANAFETWLHK